MGAEEKDAFREASQMLLDNGVSLTRLAEAFGVAVNTAWRWRKEADPRSPPGGWRGTLAQLAQNEAAEAGARRDALTKAAAHIRSLPGNL